jgi:hypothetical protein
MINTILDEIFLFFDWRNQKKASEQAMLDYL